MTLSTRGRAALGLILTVLVVGAGITAVVLVGGRAGEGSQGPGNNPTTSSTSPAPPPVCALTGQTVDSVPARPALAVKVENIPESRPQTGLSHADIVYEEPVEGGITRFIAVYQCEDASRIEPIRSGRLTDIDVLKQFGNPLFAYAGGKLQVKNAVRAAGFIDVNYIVAASAYHRDPNRQAPHNLFSSTKELYAAGEDRFEPQAPKAIFAFAPKIPGIGKPATSVHVPFSSSSDVSWKWSKSKRIWLRYHGDVPHTLSDGTQVSATNVVVQIVRTELTDVTDSNGVRSPKAITVGSGKAYLFRGGKVIVGKWIRKSASDVTTLTYGQGNEMLLVPGKTWVELLPKGKRVTFS